MADSDSDGSIFGGYINDLIYDRDRRMGEDDQSDLSLSSVHTSDLSDFHESDQELSSDEEDVNIWHADVCDKRIESFDGSPGPTTPLPMEARSVDYFYQLFPDALFEKITNETNLYAQQKRHKNWTPTSVTEIKAYLGILFYMGVIQLPNYRAYWSSKPELRQETISSIMSVNRYEQLTRAFHLNDSTQNPPRGDPTHDKLHKIRPVIDNAKEKFPALYQPHKNLAVDEAMVKFKGRCGFLQYLPSKPCKWGIKSWAIADSESFYLLNFDIYTGKETAQNNNLPLGTRVVTNLVAPYYNKAHHIYFDNFFTSVDLVECLLRNKTYSCGTVRLNRRGLPDEIKKAKLKTSGEMVKMQKGRILAVTWCEKKRQVSLLSSANKTGNIQLTRRGKRGQPDVRYPKPLAIQEYTENFNAVDKSDQLRSYYGIANKAKKWWKYVFWFICDVCVVNAYVLYKEAPGGPRPKPMSHMDFHLDVAKGLVNNYSSRRRSAPLETLQLIVRKQNVHVPTKIGSKRGVRNCVMCSKENKRTPAGNKVQSSWECKPCGVALCKDNGCFGRFHNYCH
jgi:hypothetical protein